MANTTFNASSGAFTFSPNDWSISTTAKTVNHGAHIKFYFTGTTLTLNFNPCTDTPTPTFVVSINGLPAIQYSVASSVSITMPSYTSSSYNTHYCELQLKMMPMVSSNATWTTPSTFVEFVSASVDSNCTITTVPVTLKKTMFFFGDSVCAGFNANGLANPQSDSFSHDSTLMYPRLLAKSLGARCGAACFPGQGIYSTGNGGVPGLIYSWNQHWSGKSRTWDTPPDLIAIQCIGNDILNYLSSNISQCSPSSLQSNLVSLLTAMRTALPRTNIVVMTPFNSPTVANAPASAISAYLTAVQTAINQVGVSFLDVRSVMSTSDPTSDGLHPLGFLYPMKVVPKLTDMIRPYLFNNSSFYR